MDFIIPQFLRCRFNRHAPNRHKASWDGQHFVGHCKGCGIAIRRTGKALWRKEWLVGDQDEGIRMLEKERASKGLGSGFSVNEACDEP